ncbi:MAG: sugar ABC transporter permease [Bauldia sp.]|uniref:carbohydrate ABC transporter permease n=1 Tax=Bauldia sp. TaxID=2575872 RepID=UPI001DA78800|nr:sugar ABC transporter permease [Bauldia sp.]MCB1497007.1 sugar ABC transporter permease [Bauldia sp.]
MPYLLVAPVVLMLGGLLVWPWVVGLWTSMTSLRIGHWGQEQFIGLSNYIDVLGSHAFWQSLRVTGLFAVLCVASEMSLGLGLALLLNRKLPGRNIFRTLFIIPFMVPTVVCGLIWRQLLEVRGVANYLLSFIGLGPASWLSSSDSALASLLLIDIWQTTPQVVILVFAALQIVPKDVLEAARIDGATAWQTFWRVTFPIIRPYLVVAMLIRTIELLQVLDIVMVATQGGPANATMVLHLHAYRETFISGFLGYGTAVAYVLGFIVVLVSIAIVRWIGGTQSDEARA